MNDDEKKRKIEKRCMSLAISELPQLKHYQIDESRKDNGLKEERPDFILVSPYGERIGVEHFLVDSLFNTHIHDDTIKYNSHSRQHPSKIDTLLKKYGNGKVIGNEEFALNDVYKVVTDMISDEICFDFCEFSKYFLQICSDHAKNIPDYKKAKDGFGNSISKLGFICEIDIATNDEHPFLWNVLDKRGWHLQRICGIPMLEELWIFIYILLQMELIDFFIITVISLNNEKTSKSLYFDKMSNPRTYDAFEYPITTSVRKQIDNLKGK